MHPLILLLCACASEPVAPAARAPVAPVEAEAAPAEAPAPNPHASRYGLTLGQATHEDVVAWLSAHQLTCQQFPAPTNTSFYYRCDGDLPTSLLPDRTIRGRLAQVLISRPEDAPVHHLSTLRKYSLGKDAIADYDASVAAIQAELGPPDAHQPITDPATLDRVIARYAAEWRRDGLTASVVMLKAAGNYVSVTETWAVPELKATVNTKARDGSVSGGEGRKPPGWNPHVTEIPSISSR